MKTFYYFLCLIMFVLNSFSSDLIKAVEEGNYEKCKELIMNGKDVNEISLEYSALHVAVRNDYLEIAILLLDNKANVNIRSATREFTPLHSAFGNLRMVKLLLRYGANVNLFCKYGTSSLGDAIAHSFCEIIELLLANGANPDISHKGFYTRKVKNTLSKYNNLRVALRLNKSLDLPFTKRINKINELVSKNIQDKAFIKKVVKLSEEIWCFIFFYIPAEYYKLMQVSKYFYKVATNPDVIIYLMPLIPFDKKICYLNECNKKLTKENQIEIPKEVSHEDLKNFAKENNIDF